MTAGVYTTDQLCLLARLLGAPLPPTLHPQWTDEDGLVADVVAARTLLAMGALALVPGAAALRPTAAVAGGLDPVRDATAVVEVSHTGPDGAVQRQVLAGHEGAGLRLREREPDVWVLEPGRSVAALLGETVAGLTDGGTGAGRVVLARRAGPERFVLDEVRWRHDGTGWWLAGPVSEWPVSEAPVSQGPVSEGERGDERSDAAEVAEALRGLLDALADPPVNAGSVTR